MPDVEQCRSRTCTYTGQAEAGPASALHERPRHAQRSPVRRARGLARPLEPSARPTSKGPRSSASPAARLRLTAACWAGADAAGAGTPAAGASPSEAARSSSARRAAAAPPDGAAGAPAEPAARAPLGPAGGSPPERAASASWRPALGPPAGAADAGVPLTLPAGSAAAGAAWGPASGAAGRPGAGMRAGAGLPGAAASANSSAGSAGGASMRAAAAGAGSHRWPPGPAAMRRLLRGVRELESRVMCGERGPSCAGPMSGKLASQETRGPPAARAAASHGCASSCSAVGRSAGCLTCACRAPAHLSKLSSMRDPVSSGDMLRMRCTLANVRLGPHQRAPHKVDPCAGVLRGELDVVAVHDAARGLALRARAPSLPPARRPRLRLAAQRA